MSGINVTTVVLCYDRDRDICGPRAELLVKAVTAGSRAFIIPAITANTTINAPTRSSSLSLFTTRRALRKTTGKHPLLLSYATF